VVVVVVGLKNNAPHYSAIETSGINVGIVYSKKDKNLSLAVMLPYIKA